MASIYARQWQRTIAAHKRLADENMASYHWEADMWKYWQQQETPPSDNRWMPAWLSTHKQEDIPPLARNPKEQHEVRLNALKDAYYDEVRLIALKRLRGHA